MIKFVEQKYTGSNNYNGGTTMENINITGSTRLTGLLGSPVAHSKSPAMHNEAFRLLGLDYVYALMWMKIIWNQQLKVYEH